MTAMPASDRITTLPTADKRLYAQVAKAIHYIVENQFDQPELDDIARHAGMSPHHFQRVFSDWVGISPKKFLKAVTLAEAKTRLRDSQSVLDAAFDTGLSGPGRLHDLFVSTDAVTPGEYKSHGLGMTLRWGVHPSPFGDCLFVVSERGLTGMSFIDGDLDHALAEQTSGWEKADWTRDTDATAPYARAAFGANDVMASNGLKLLLRGSPFRVKVWEALLRVPAGTVLSYGDLATRLGRPNAARAVAGAVAGNLLGFVIPCHRVIRETGALSGYRWGPTRKAAMLGFEAAATTDLGLETPR